MKYYIIILILFFSGRCVAQDLDQSYLNTLGDEPLLALYDKHYGDSIALEKIARTYLDRARKQKDTIKMARGYDRLARTFHPEKNIAFADSVIYLTKRNPNITYPGLGYILKGIELSNFDLSKSTENFYTAYDYALAEDNLSQLLFVWNTLIIRKSFWGKPEDPLDMQREKEKLIYSEHFRKRFESTFRKGIKKDIDEHIDKVKFNSGVTFVICFINNKQIDSAEYYFQKVKDIYSTNMGKPLFSNELIVYELENEINFYSGKYSNTIESCNSILKKVSNSNLYGSAYDAYMFKGLSNINIGKESKGVEMLLKADSLHNLQHVRMLPYRQKVFKSLLEYYETRNNKEKQIYFSKKIIKVDSAFKRNYAYYENSLNNRIETPTLLAEKENIIKQLEKEVALSDPKFFISLTVLFITLSILLFILRKRIVYRRRFELLMAQKYHHEVQKNINNDYHTELSSEVIENILEKLQEFESNQGYLKQSITLGSLAKYCKTNSNYLSRVINLKIEKNFSQYLHQLRLEYAMNRILNDATIRKFTIKAIAAECGYKNAESFSKAFYKNYGIYPSYYIKKIERGKIEDLSK
ncbi:MAG TPA: hypothetical protein DEA82_10340 [Flavobacteriaceae bacterium]|nr:hypothetical protein [Flavobacteriaceae bacterium]